MSIWSHSLNQVERPLIMKSQFSFFVPVSPKAKHAVINLISSHRLGDLDNSEIIDLASIGNGWPTQLSSRKLSIFSTKDGGSPAEAARLTQAVLAIPENARYKQTQVLFTYSYHFDSTIKKDEMNLMGG